MNISPTYKPASVRIIVSMLSIDKFVWGVVYYPCYYSTFLLWKGKNAMTTDLTFNPACVNCGARMGEMSEEEFASLVIQDGDAGLCFDCDPDSASTTPSLFWQWKEGDVFVLGDASFVVSQRENSESSILWLSHTRALARARSCLSSSTYLNRFNDDRPQWVKDLPQWKLCPKCKDEVLTVFTDGWHCKNCGNFVDFPDGTKVSEDVIIIPDWIIGPQIQDGDYCQDCVRVNGRVVGYCGYHSALYDGLVGVNYDWAGND